VTCFNKSPYVTLSNASDLSIIGIARWIRLDIGAAGASAMGKMSSARHARLRALEIVGDKWTLLIVRDLMWHGKHTFTRCRAQSISRPTSCRIV
jgi:hypothetical protein